MWRQTCSGWQAAPSTINAATGIIQLHLLFLPRQKLIHGTRCATHSTDWPMSQRQVSTIWWDHLYVSITATSDNWAAAVIVLSFDRLTSRRKVTTLTASRRYTASCMSSHCHSVSGEYHNTALPVYDRWYDTRHSGNAVDGDFDQYGVRSIDTLFNLYSTMMKISSTSSPPVDS